MTTMLAAPAAQDRRADEAGACACAGGGGTNVLVTAMACGVVPNLINVLTQWQSWFPELSLPKLPPIYLP